MAQLVHPTADIFVQGLTSGRGWEHSGGGTTYYTEVDESVASDADWIQGDISAPNLSTGSCQLRLGGVMDPGVNTGFKLRFRVNWNISYIDVTPNAPDGDWNVNLYAVWSGINPTTINPLTLGTISANTITTQPVTAGVWTTVEYSFTSDDIAAWRTLIGFGLPTTSVGTFAQPFVTFTLALESGFSQPDPTNGNLWATISWVEFEAPDIGGGSGTPLMADLTATGGVKVGGEADMAASTFIVFSADGTGVKVTGRTQFETFSPSIPETQVGGQWRLNSFTFKYRPEETN
jgi:hypothetical protein